MRSALLCLLSAWLSLNIVWAANLGATAPAGSDLAQAQKQIAQKDWKSAVVTLEKYTKANPTDAEGFNLLGYSYRNIRRYDESFAAYRQALTLDPKHREAHRQLATVSALGLMSGVPT